MSDRSTRNPLLGGGTQRLEALADGVFSIVMTLVVFEIALPKDRTVEDLSRALVDLWPSFLAYAITVGLVGIFWSAHRSQFLVIRRTDTVLNWLNLLFLSLVSLVPFSTKLLAIYHRNSLALAVYGINLTAIGLALMSIWRHATLGRRLVDPDLPTFAIRYGYSRCLVGAIGYAWASILAFVSTTTALVVFTAIPFLYVLPSIQRLWMAWFELQDQPEAGRPSP